MRKSFYALFLLMALLTLSACATAPVIQTELQPGALKRNSVGIAWISRCHKNDCLESENTKANFTPIGVSGLLDMAIVNAAHDGLELQVERLDATDKVEKGYLDKLVAALKSQGINAAVARKPFSPTALRTSRRLTGVILQEGAKGNRPPRDTETRVRRVSQLKLDLLPVSNELQVEQLIVLELLEYGVRRQFGPFAIPTSPSYSVAAVRGSLVDVSTGEMLLNNYAFYENEPGPDTDDSLTDTKMRELLAGVDEALESAIDDVTSGLIAALGSR